MRAAITPIRIDALDVPEFCKNALYQRKKAKSCSQTVSVVAKRKIKGHKTLWLTTSPEHAHAVTVKSSRGTSLLDHVPNFKYIHFDLRDANAQKYFDYWMKD